MKFIDNLKENIKQKKQAKEFVEIINICKFEEYNSMKSAEELKENYFKRLCEEFDINYVIEFGVNFRDYQDKVAKFVISQGKFKLVFECALAFKNENLANYIAQKGKYAENLELIKCGNFFKENIDNVLYKKPSESTCELAFKFANSGIIDFEEYDKYIIENNSVYGSFKAAITKIDADVLYQYIDKLNNINVDVTKLEPFLYWALKTRIDNPSLTLDDVIASNMEILKKGPAMYLGGCKERIIKYKDEKYRKAFVKSEIEKINQKIKEEEKTKQTTM